MSAWVSSGKYGRKMSWVISAKPEGMNNIPAGCASNLVMEEVNDADLADLRKSKKGSAISE